MESSDLTPDQLERLRLTLARHREYITRLRERLAKLCFPESDPLTPATRRASDAMDALYGVVRDLQERAPLPRHAGGQRPVEVRRDPRARRQ